MRLFGLIGYPLSHSFSQKYFTEKFEREGYEECSYLNFAIPEISKLKNVIEENPGLEGLNVTIPYKEQVLSFLNDMTELVNQVGACNCIKIEKGRLKGFNTDVIGFEKSFLKYIKPWHKQALVLGSGGASKAVQFILNKNKIPFKVVSRNPAQGELGYDTISEDLMVHYQIIINTTPLGMQPNIHLCPSLPYLSLSNTHYLFDLVYNPAKTLFLEKGEQQGATIQSGYEMLIYQAEESWKIWNS